MKKLTILFIVFILLGAGCANSSQTPEEILDQNHVAPVVGDTEPYVQTIILDAERDSAIEYEIID